MNSHRKIVVTGLLLLLVAACREAGEWDFEEYDPRLSGGSQTIFSEGVGAFSQAFPDLSEERMELHELGDLHFESTFIGAPAPKFSGLGTVYNNNACVNCHINDGRGKPIEPGEPLASILFRISVPGTNPHGGALGAPGFGEQLQDKAVFGYQPELKVDVTWHTQPFTFADGETTELRYPEWHFINSYIPIPAGAMFSARIAPPVHGLGLLEQVEESTLLSFADPNDKNMDGISGKANYGWDAPKQRTMIGRFGWKSEAPTLAHQIAGAYNEDMGITSYVMPVESHAGQSQYDGLNDETEVPDSIFNAVVFYVQSLAVPARRKVTDAQIKRGEELFSNAKCSSCHIPVMRTGTNVSFPEASNQVIRPYTDLLLHDMGEALSDHRPSFLAEGNEWRTPPLWGIGLTQLVNGHNNYLHDGRARNLLEAILWHGGEAETSKEYFRNLPKADRDALIGFLKSL